MSTSRIARAALVASPGVFALVGERIHYTVAPQGEARPYLVITGGVERDGRTLAGADRFPEAAFTVVAVADSYTAADAIGDAVIAALENAAGAFDGRRATFWRDDVGGVDYVPADKAHRLVVGFRCRYR